MTAKHLIEQKINLLELNHSKARGMANSSIDKIINALEDNRLKDSHDIELIQLLFSDMFSSMSHVNTINMTRSQFESLLLSFD